jgi:glycosyltransferase involved in cell wall biosynthesis
VTSPAISVVVPTYRGQEWIEGCLDSVAAQTLARDLFEVVVVRNGPDAGTDAIVAAWCAAHPDVAVRHLVTETASLPGAENLALDAARGRWVTFLDDDDRLAPRHLEALLAVATPGVVAVAPIGMVYDADFAAPRFDNWLTAPLLPYGGRELAMGQVGNCVHTVHAKLIPTEVARRVRFDETLKPGEDTVLLLRVLAEGSLRLALADLSADAAYLYQQRAGTITTQERTWDFAIRAHLDAIAAVDAVDSADEDVVAIRRTLVRNFLITVRGYARAHPEQAAKVDLAVRERALREVPWDVLHEGRAAELAILDVGDRESIASFTERGVVADLLALPLLATADDADRQDALALSERFLGAAGAPVGWTTPGALAGDVRALVEQLAAGREGYALWTGAGAIGLLLGALVKLALPGLRWTARLTPDGGAGVDVPAQADETLHVLAAGLAAAGLGLEEFPETMGALAELVAAGLADELVVSTPRQLEELIERCPDERYVARVRKRARLGDEGAAQLSRRLRRRQGRGRSD